MKRAVPSVGDKADTRRAVGCRLCVQSSTLRELVDDMDWAGAPVCITMRSEPPALSFSAHGQVVGDLKVRDEGACVECEL